MARLTPPKSPVVCEKHQSKCMWSLYNLFDFRQAHSKRKLLSDNRGLRTYVVGDANLQRSVDTPNKFEEKAQGINVRSNIYKPNNRKVKGEEKHIDENQINTKIATSETKHVESDSIIVGKSQKNHGKAKTSQKKLSHPNSVNKSLNNLEFASRVNPKNRRGLGCRSINFVRHDKDSEIKLVQMNDLAEAIVNQKFINGKCQSTIEVSQQSKQLLEALEILNSNKELFSNLLKDPNSLLVKHIQDFRDSQAKQSEHQTSSSSTCDQKLKSCDEYSSSDQQSEERIIVLKPGLRSMESSSDKSNKHSSMKSYHSLSDIKRKLRHVMWGNRKESPSNFKDSRDGVKENGREISRRNLWSINQVDNSSIVHSSPDIPKNDVSIEMLKDLKSSNRHETFSSSETRISKETLKHFSEMLKSGNEDKKFYQQQAPGYQHGEISTYPDYDFLSVCNVGGYRDNDFMQRRPLFYSSNQMVYERVTKEQQNRFSTSLEKSIQASQGKKKPKNQLKGLNSKQNISDNLFAPTKVLEVDHSNIRDPGKILSNKNTRSNLETNDIELTDLLEGPAKPCNANGKKPNKRTATSNMFEENECSNFSRLVNDMETVHNSCFEGRMSIFPVDDFPPTPPDLESLGDPDSIKDGKDQSSPVSVLEQYITDAPSTSSTTYEPVEQKNYESLLKSHLDPVIKIPTSLDDYECTYEYVREVVLQGSSLNWDELMVDPSLLDEVKAQANQLNCDCKLLNDCINQSLLEAYHNHFRFYPWVSSIKSNVPMDKFVNDEVTKCIDWYLHPQLPSSSLEQLLEKDIAKSGTWLEIRSDIEDIVNELVESTLEEFVTDTMIMLAV